MLTVVVLTAESKRMTILAHYGYSERTAIRAGR